MLNVRHFAISATAVALLATPAWAELIKKESPHTVPQTVQRLQAVLKDKNLTVFATIDHAAGAEKVKQELRPTTLVIFGNPAAGTPLMQAKQTMGLSLPLKILVWQDDAGKVWLGYDTPASVAAERGVAKDHPVIGKMAGALNGIAEAAIQK